MNAGEEVVIILEGSRKKVDDKAGGDIFLLDTKPEVKLKDKPLGPRYRRVICWFTSSFLQLVTL